MARVTVVRAEVPLYGPVDRRYEVRLDGVRIGEVVRDDIEHGGYRHVWHGFLDEFPGAEEAGWDPASWDEAVGSRRLTRAEAVDDVLDEFLDVSSRLGVVLP